MSMSELKESEINALRRVCECLFIQVPEHVAQDVKTKAEAVIALAQCSHRAAVAGPQCDIEAEIANAAALSNRGRFEEAFNVLVHALRAAAASFPTPAETLECRSLGYVYEQPRDRQWCVTHNQLISKCDYAPPERTRVEGEQVSIESAYNDAIEDAKTAIREERAHVDDPYAAATFINAIARKCCPRQYAVRKGKDMHLVTNNEPRANVISELCGALETAINSVECASIDQAGEELPWYKQALNALESAGHPWTGQRRQ